LASTTLRPWQRGCGMEKGSAEERAGTTGEGRGRCVGSAGEDDDAVTRVEGVDGQIGAVARRVFSAPHLQCKREGAGGALP